MLLQVLILRQVDLLPDLLSEFTNAGIVGSTVIDCEGALQVLGQASIDAPPIFASLRKFLNPDQESNKLVLTVLSEEMYPKARNVVANVIGDITAPGTGIIFTVPITNVEGLAKRKMDNLILGLAIAMGCGLLFNRIAKKIGLPNVTGYLVGGLLIGGSVFKIISFEAVEQLNSIVEVALGFIAFSIGGEFKLSYLRKLGSRVITVTCFEALTAVVLVDAALLICGFPPAESIALGAIAAATAPAATLMVVRQYKADGPVTRTLLPVVAMDDAICLMAFSLSVSIAKALEADGGVNYASMILSPLIEIFGSLLIGAAIGLVLTFCLRFFKSRANRLTLVICAVFLGVALADVLGLSSLLLCMMIAAVLANLYNDLNKLLDVVDHWTPPLFLLFFVLSGADLDLSVLPKVGLMGVLYLGFRSLGIRARA